MVQFRGACERPALIVPPTRLRQLVGVLGAFGLAACAGNDPADLLTIYSGEHSVVGDEAAIVSLHLQPGTYLIEGREQDVDLSMTIGTEAARAKVEDAIPRHGLHVQVINLKTAGELRIELHSRDHRAKRGTVRLRASRWRRAADAAPGERELGYAAMGLAGAQTAEGTGATWTKAADLLNEAAGHFELARDESARAQARYTLSHLQYFLIDDREAAIRAAVAAKGSYEEIEDEAGVHNAETLRAAAELEIASGMNASTQTAAQRALYAAADRRLIGAEKFFEQHRLPINAEYVVNMRGVRAVYRGEYDDAMKFFTRAIAMARANQDAGEELKSLANLAWVHYSLGFIAEAAREYSELLPLIERDRQLVLYGAILNNYGFCLVALGDFDRALELNTDALQLYSAQGRELEVGRQLTALGTLYFRTGDLPRSLETLRSAIELQERIGDAVGQAPALRIAGNAAAILGQHGLALEYLRKSVQIESKADYVARGRTLIAGELRALGDFRGAETELRTALESDNPLSHAEALAERGRLRLAQKDYAAAIADLRAADRQFIALEHEFNRIDTNTALSQALLASNDVAGATAAADEAVSSVSRIRLKSANPEWRARFLSARYQPYEARIAAELASSGKDTEERVWRAFRIAENVRARSLADLLAAQRRDGVRDLDPQGDALRAKLTAQQLRLETLMQGADTYDPGHRQLRRAIVETRAKVDAHQVQQKSVVAGDSILTESLRDVQSRLPDDTGVLAYFVGDQSSHAWILTRTELRHGVLPARGELQKLVDAFVKTQQTGIKTADVSRFRPLLGKLLNGVKAGRLLVLPDGPLNGLPFAALPMPNGRPRELLMDRFVITTAPSLGLAMSTRARRPIEHAVIAVISDPVYSRDDRRLTMATNQSVNYRGADGAAARLGRLPYSAIEARTVVKAFTGSEVIELGGFDATARRVLELPSARLSVLHFATHAVARRDAPEQSALFLSEFSTDGSPVADTRLTAGDIARSGLRADIVVLSGCATGIGSELRGEGVLGLAYGFLANGSHTVIASLWPVEDALTARFMAEFYASYRESGRASEALRTAQLRTRHAAGAAVWSSFVVRANDLP
jgi:tetratricopeptide (TPR) repeat protein